MKFGIEVGLGPGNIVLDGNQAPRPKKGGTAAPHFSAHVLWPNGWMDQHATWYGGRLPVNSSHGHLITRSTHHQSTCHARVSSHSQLITSEHI